MTDRRPKTRNPEHGTVLVAMSGGVDSSTAAAILVEQGYRVAGVTMLLWPEDVPGAEEGCCGSVHLADAREVCHSLGIRHYTMDLQKEFLTEVVRPFVATYMEGRTPNPCISCNEHLKFHHLMRKAAGIGADFLATGHYARILANGSFRLARGVDPAKDQSYFLFTLGQEELSRLLFPLGALTKEQVREKARSFSLPVHEKAESQEICFVPPGELREFIRDRAPEFPGPGDVVDLSGEVIGRHEGACFYTVGQRRGLGIAGREAMYVVRIDAPGNTLVLGTRPDASSEGLRAEGVRWVGGDPPAPGFEALVQIRHRHIPAPARVTVRGDGSMLVAFEVPQHGVAPGQAVVVYDGDLVLGGGWITGPTGP